MTAPQPDPQALAVIAAYQSQTAALRASIGKYIQTLWRSLGEWRTPQIAPFVKQAVPTVAGAQHTMTALTVAYLAALRRLDVGAAGKAISVDPKMVSRARARNGVSPAEVYERPFHLVWRQLADLPHVEGSIDKAIDAGMKRAVVSALTDLQLTKVQTSQRVLAKDGTVTSFRRVLEGPQSCALCIVAATQRYHHEKLLPIHPGCDCSVEPLRDGSSGQAITAAVRVGDELVPVTDLPDIHDRIRERFGASSSAARIIPGARDAEGNLLRYRDVLVTHEHGELGPVLGVKGQPFLGPGDDDVPELRADGTGGNPPPPTPPVPPGGGADPPSGGGAGGGSQPPEMPRALGTPEQQTYVKGSTLSEHGPITPGPPRNNANYHHAYVPDPEDRTTALLQYVKSSEDAVKVRAAELLAGQPMSQDVRELVEIAHRHLTTIGSYGVRPGEYPLDDAIRDIEGAAARLIRRPLRRQPTTYRGIAAPAPGDQLDDAAALAHVRTHIDLSGWAWVSGSTEYRAALQYAFTASRRRPGLVAVVLEVEDALGINLDSMGRMAEAPEVLLVGNYAFDLVKGEVNALGIYRVGVKRQP